MREILPFFGLYIVISVEMIPVAMLVLYLVLGVPNYSDLGSVAAGVTAFVFGTIIGMTLGLVGMSFSNTGRHCGI
ncbi:MAG: hypothetical protein GYB65_24065 [Chloroflexi bacterium]|nr:hypothetical protein [Chloroflexota bacterium]